MYDIHCPICSKRYLIGTRSINSFHNTSDGPIAYVSCPAGHHLVRSFRGRSATAEADPHPEVA